MRIVNVSEIEFKQTIIKLMPGNCITIQRILHEFW